MRKLLLITLSAIFLTFLLVISAHAATNEAELAQKTYQSALKDIDSTISDKDLSVNSKLKALELYLEAAQPFISSEDYSLLFKRAESTLFFEADDLDTTLWQLIFLMGQYSNSSVWVFSAQRDVVTNKIVELNKKANQRYGKDEKLEAINGSLFMLIATELSDHGQFEEADKWFDKLFITIKASGELYPLVKYTVSGLKLKSLFARGDMVNAMKLSQELDADFESNVEKFSTFNESTFGSKGLSGLSTTFQVEIFLGKNEAVIKKATLLLSKIPNNEVNKEIQEARLGLIKILASAYKNIGNDQQAAFYKKEAKYLESKLGYIDVVTFFQNYYSGMFASNFELAKESVNGFGNYYASLYPFADIKEKELMAKIINEFKAFIAEEEFNANNPTKCDSDECIKARKQLEAYELDIKNGVYRSPELAQLFRLVITLSEDLDAGDKRSKRRVVHASRMAPILEDMYYEGMVTGVLTVSGELEYLDGLYSYYILFNKPYAAYYAKQYINKFQSLRRMVNVVNTQDLQLFTDSKSDILKSFSKTFFEIGDINSALMVLQIIKENEFFDFVRRKNVNENLLSFLSFSKEENDFNVRIESVLMEIKAMKGAEISKNKQLAESELIKKAILIKQQELDNLRKNLKLSIAKPVNSIASLSKPPPSQKLNSNEAILQVFLTPNSVESYLTTIDKTEHFVTEIDRERVTSKILELNLLLSEKLVIPDDQVLYLSKALLPDLTNIINQGKVKKLKIVTDSYLTLIPLNILKMNGVEIGELFVTETLSLVNKSKNSKNNSKAILDAFGASEGNAEFKSLPGVRTEIATLMTVPMTTNIKNRNYYLDGNFNRKQFIKSFEQGSSIIHIASHFRSQGNLAGSSKLLLGDGSTISLEDIRAVLPQLNTNLITLSACDTGDLIPSTKGQAFEGLSNTFQANGARNVISTLWSISDEVTAKFMGIFYTLLLNNNISPSEALFYTQNIFRHGSVDILPKNIIFTNFENQSLLSNLNKFSHPYYWAAFRISSLN